jgi:diguanylate cyclase (GGDEF)-like protein
MAEAKIQYETFAGPLPQEAYAAATAEFKLFRQDRVLEAVARARYGEKIAGLALAESNQKLEDRKTDSVSGLLAKEEWMDQANRKITGFEFGRRSEDKVNGAVLIMFDAIGFKKINDEISWAEGNRRLGVIGKYLRDTARLDNGDLLSRLGGDEFFWLIPYDSAETTGEEVMASIEKRLREPLLEKYPGLLPLRWNHVFYQEDDDIQDMIDRLDVKGPQKPMTRTHSQNQADYEDALEKAGLVLV